jgi:hypothetical protein
MSDQDTSGYEVLLARARRNFALCVVQIQNVEYPIKYGPNMVCQRYVEEWWSKADRLQFAINAASGLLAGGDLAQACKILAKENEAR